MIKLLVVDDNIGMTDVLSLYFKEDKDIKVSFVAHNGEEAIDVLDKHKDEIDMVLLDIIMPKKDGVYVLEEMKNRNINKKVIVETSYDSEEMIKLVGKMGASYFITKPFELDELRKRILVLSDSKLFDSKMISLASNELENTVTKILHELGIPSHIKGYQYIRDGIIMIFNDPSLVGAITKILYPELAKKHSTTSSRVERAMRHAIEVGWIRSDWKMTEDLFGQSVDFNRTKPTNSEFLVTIADKIRLGVPLKI